MYKSILQGGVNKTVRHRDFPAHKHYADEIYVCLGGSATDITEEEEKAVLPGDVYVHRRGVIHRQTDISDFYCCVFQFDREELIKRSKELNLAFSVLFSDEEKGLFVDANTVRYIEIISDIMKSEEDIEVMDMMFLNLLNIISKKSKVRAEEDGCEIREDIEEIIRYIEHNYDKTITLDTLARLSHYSKRHFTRLFREICGMSPMDYLNKVRIKNASDLLVRSDMNIIEISRLCGFEDNNLFSRRFKSIYKVSPTQYRRLNRIK